MNESPLPDGESLRRAIRWISDRRLEQPNAKLGKIIEEAALRFDLSPLESDWLWRNLARLKDG